MRSAQPLLLFVVLTSGVLTPQALSQPTPAPAEEGETTIAGTVVSSSANTLVVRTSTNVHQLFVYDGDTAKPAAIGPGSEVTVVSVPTSEPGVRLARQVTVAAESAPPKTTPGTPAQTGPAKPPPPVPVSIRRLERDIERQARRYGAGVRAGVALDPEVLLIGLHARMGPFFARSISFRPNVEFGFGEVTKLFALNLEGVYRLPFTPARGRWSAYAGLGPSFIFSHQNFERAAAGDAGVDFGDFDFEAGLNVFAGVEFRNGVFVETKTTVYASPHLRIIVGYSF
jgi:hypothetical protein